MGARHTSATWTIIGLQTSAILFAAVAISDRAAAQSLRETVPPESAIPANLIAPEAVRPLVSTMWRQSPTFRRQCARLAENPAVVVTIELVAGSRHRRAMTRVQRHDTGLRAAVQIELRKPTLYVEHIAHELEHVLEYLDGTDLPRLARQRVDGVMEGAGQYETARARAVGITVAREAM
jgi:hypothetical protein